MLRISAFQRISLRPRLEDETRDTARSTDLLKILGQELREHYELPRNLPHGMLTLLMQLSVRGGKSDTAK
jgi:hypothetical protein